MDMMEMRRMVMGQMSSGAKFVKGTFTVPDSGSSYTLNFGKTFSHYIFLIEATDETKTAILSSGINATKSFTLIGAYPRRTIGEYTDNGNGTYRRINPSTKSFDQTNLANVVTLDDKLDFTINSLSDGSSVLFRGYTYNYYIVEIK